MSSEISENALNSIELLSKIYEKIDIFDTIMESLEEILDTSIRLYEDIEEMTIYKCELEESCDDTLDVQNKIHELSEFIEVK